MLHFKILLYVLTKCHPLFVQFMNLYISIDPIITPYLRIQIALNTLNIIFIPKCFMFLLELKDSITISIKFTHILIGNARNLSDFSLMSPGTVKWNYTLFDFQTLSPSSKTSLGRDS